MADFLGVSNLMTATAGGRHGDGGRVHLGTFELSAQRGDLDSIGPVKLVIRPERVQLEEHGTTGPNRVPGMVERVLYVGSIMQVLVHLAHGETLQSWEQNQGGDLQWQQGTAVTVYLPPEALRILPDVDVPAVEEEPAPAPAG